MGNSRAVNIFKELGTLLTTPQAWNKNKQKNQNDRDRLQYPLSAGLHNATMACLKEIERYPFPLNKFMYVCSLLPFGVLVLANTIAATIIMLCDLIVDVLIRAGMHLVNLTQLPLCKDIGMDVIIHEERIIENIKQFFRLFKAALPHPVSLSEASNYDINPPGDTLRFILIISYPVRLILSFILLVAFLALAFLRMVTNFCLGLTLLTNYAVLLMSMGIAALPVVLLSNKKSLLSLTVAGVGALFMGFFGAPVLAVAGLTLGVNISMTVGVAAVAAISYGLTLIATMICWPRNEPLRAMDTAASIAPPQIPTEKMADEKASIWHSCLSAFFCCAVPKDSESPQERLNLDEDLGP